MGYLFRGQLVDTDEWIEGDGIHYPKSPNYLGQVYIDSIQHEGWHQVKPETVSIHTGKIAINRTVYPGDIFIDLEHDDDEENSRLLIRWDNQKSRFCVVAYQAILCGSHIVNEKRRNITRWEEAGRQSMFDYGWESMQYVGNIADHPEMTFSAMPLLFRGKRPDTGEWIEGDGVYHPKSYNHQGEVYIDGMQPRANDWLRVTPETVGLFTGKVAKTGNVYAGDIFVHDNETLIVTWNDKSCGFYVAVLGYDDLFNENEKCEVDSRLMDEFDWSSMTCVGNEWDNPELLK